MTRTKGVMTEEEILLFDSLVTVGPVMAGSLADFGVGQAVKSQCRRPKITRKTFSQKHVKKIDSKHQIHLYRLRGSAFQLWTLCFLLLFFRKHHV